MRSYLVIELAKAKKPYAMNAKKKIAKINSALEILTRLETKCREWEIAQITAAGRNVEDYFPEEAKVEFSPDNEKAQVIRSFPKPYIVGAPIRKEVFLTETKEGVTLTGVKLTTVWGESQPNRF
jgi:hypothetical protein